MCYSSVHSGGSWCNLIQFDAIWGSLVGSRESTTMWCSLAQSGESNATWWRWNTKPSAAIWYNLEELDAIWYTLALGCNLVQSDVTKCLWGGWCQDVRFRRFVSVISVSVVVVPGWVALTPDPIRCRTSRYCALMFLLFGQHTFCVSTLRG